MFIQKNKPKLKKLKKILEKKKLLKKIEKKLKKKKKLNQQALSHENLVVGIPNLQRVNTYQSIRERNVITKCHTLSIQLL